MNKITLKKKITLGFSKKGGNQSYHDKWTNQNDLLEDCTITLSSSFYINIQ